MEELFLDKLKFFKNKYKQNHQYWVSNLFENIIIKLSKTKLNNESYTKLNDYIDAIRDAFPISGAPNMKTLINLVDCVREYDILNELLNKYKILSSKQIKEKFNNNCDVKENIKNHEYALIKNDEIILLFASFEDVFIYLYTKEYNWINNKFIDSIKE